MKQPLLIGVYDKLHITAMQNIAWQTQVTGVEETILDTLFALTNYAEEISICGSPYFTFHCLDIILQDLLRFRCLSLVKLGPICAPAHSECTDIVNCCLTF